MPNFVTWSDHMLIRRAEDDPDINKEYQRQRTFLEKNIDSLNRKLQKDASVHKKDHLRIIQVWLKAAPRERERVSYLRTCEREREMQRERQRGKERQRERERKREQRERDREREIEREQRERESRERERWVDANRKRDKAQRKRGRDLRGTKR